MGMITGDWLEAVGGEFKKPYYKNLYEFVFDGIVLSIECFNIELLSITESEPFQRGMIWLDDPNQTADSGKMMYRT